MKTILTFLLAASTIGICAQNSYDDFRKQRMTELNSFRQEKENEYKEYRDRMNAEYAKFMRETWESFNGKAPCPQPEHDAPVVPPVTIEDESNPLESTPLPYKEVVTMPAPTPVPQPITPIEEQTQPGEQTITMLFYGTECTVRIPAKRHTLQTTDEEACADHWEWMAKYCNNLLHDCLDTRKKLALCDWGYVKFTECVAHQVFPSYDEAVIAHTFLLSQSGFRVHIARDDEQRLHMLVAANDQLYNFPYFTLDDNEPFYLIDGSKCRHLYIFTRSFPKEQPLRMNITQEMKLKLQPGEKRQLQAQRYSNMQASVNVNQNLIAFYNDYPASFMNNDERTKWFFYAQAPLSKEAREQLYPELQQAIQGKNEWEAVSMLLNFVQTAFEYEYDDKIWGYDRAFFADETLHYPYADCEDRSILFSHLVRDLLHLDVVLLYYPGHLATAVHFTKEQPGDFLSIDTRKYIVCDPTYIGASPGRTMPGMDNSQAFVIKL